MNYPPVPVCPYPATLSRKNLQDMIRLVRLLHQLSTNHAYQTLLQKELPSTARIDNRHYAVMMGYDFHISPTGPKLIEVNTNAGGLWLASLCYQPNARTFPKRLENKLLQTFLNDYALFRQNPQAHPELIVILDEHPETQFLYPEMQIFAQLFRQAGIETVITAPENLTGNSDGIYLDHKRIDLIYNRHCDFYLETANMSAIRAAWLNAQLCLSPNPRVYGLLADKRRMINWSNPETLQKLQLSAAEIALLKQTIPKTLSLADLTPEQAWNTRKQWVFKPETSYGSRGVYVGDKLTKGKLAELNPENTLIQERVPASITRINDDVQFKTDFRLFTYRQKILAVSARLYQGQVTNLRTENGGFAKVRLVE